MLNIKEAIEISRILCKAPEERLEMILAVYEEAGIIISGLEELEEWKSLKDQSGLIDIQEFLEDLETLYPADGKGDIRIRPDQLQKVCDERKVKVSCCKRILARKGYLKTYMDGSKLNYTVTLWVDGQSQRFVVINREPVYLKEVV